MPFCAVQTAYDLKSVLEILRRRKKRAGCKRGCTLLIMAFSSSVFALSLLQFLTFNRKPGTRNLNPETGKLRDGLERHKPVRTNGLLISNGSAVATFKIRFVGPVV